MALEHWLTLAMTHGIGPVAIQRLIEVAGSAQAVCDMTANDLRHVEGIGSSKGATLHETIRRARDSAEGELRRVHALGLGLICPEDSAYPSLLRWTPDPPSVLYVQGTLEPRDLNAIAIVGSRRCSHYGREQAERFGALLAGAGFTIVSGGARGTDSAAHRGAIANPLGRTIAVLGSGIDMIYPPENGALFRQIAERGAVISEFPLGTPPVQSNFPQRNRIVSGMSRGVMVIEADERSGALITARLAADDHNRPVFALPGRVDNTLSAGPHRLIRDGAILVRDLQDILDGLDPLPRHGDQPTLFAEPDLAVAVVHEPSPRPAEAAVSLLSGTQQSVLEQLNAQPSSVDALVEQTGLDAGVVLRELTFLSLKGLARRVDGQSYARR